ncbi:MAG: hypothetical protein ABS44_04260 [Chryseobacterium sp. SCN 40-13]|nr:MAG: hypothetical protein ABS44_04260 [Chryseobacterium sp. SCN 40-13]
MVLTMVPCNDAAKGLSEKFCQNQDVHLEQSQNQHADFCSPFCVCNCCGMNLSVSQINTLLPEHHKVVIKDILPDRTYDHKTLHPADIWQPPKIG